VFDLLASLLSGPVGFRYEAIFWVSLAIYAAAGFFAARQLGSVRAAARTSSLVGLADATIGWAISYAVEPDLYGYADDVTIPLVTVVVALVVLTAALLGALGGVAGKRVRASRT
jgi:hypothetical protein